MIASILSFFRKREIKKLSDDLLKALSDTTLKKDTTTKMARRIEIPNWNTAEREQAFTAMSEVYTEEILKRILREG